MRQRLYLGLLILAPIAVGCQSRPVESGSSTPNASQTTADRVAAYIDGKPVTRDTLYQMMAESAGGEALSELLLDRTVTRRLADQGMALTEADVQAERQRLMASLSPEPDTAARLLRAMRDQRGLGDKRFEALLRRNAGLRKLVRSDIKIEQNAVLQAYELRYGKRYRVRLITADTVNALGRARQRALAGESFADLAIEVSTDESVNQGGLLSPISPADPTYPKAIRDALPRLSTDSTKDRLSPVIALPKGYALLWLEQAIKTDPPALDQVRDQLEQAVRTELERVRMQQLARVMLGQANVIVLDPELDASWKRQREAVVEP